MLEIVYDDAHIAVCVKPVGTSAQAEAPGAMPQLLRAQLGCEAVFPVHRLDQIVGGVMVYAKTQPAAAALSRQVQAGGLQKEYLAVLRGAPERQADTLCDLLYHDRTKNKTYVVTRKRAGAREARLASRSCACSFSRAARTRSARSSHPESCRFWATGNTAAAITAARARFGRTGCGFPTRSAARK